MKILSTFALGSLLLVGCGGSDILGTDDAGTTADMTLQLYKLQSGQYTVTSLTVGNDGCMVNPNDPLNPTIGIDLTLTNDGAGNIGLGKVGGTPPEPSNGASCPGNPANPACATATMSPIPFSDNQGTLVRDNDIDDGNGCTEHRHVENLLQLTADNTFTSSYTNTDSKHVGCSIKVDCTTTYTWSFTKK
ncbi:MAG: hypothetical protein ABI321_03055 [Polyangia bacterium]